MREARGQGGRAGPALRPARRPPGDDALQRSPGPAQQLGAAALASSFSHLGVIATPDGVQIRRSRSWISVPTAGAHPAGFGTLSRIDMLEPSCLGADLRPVARSAQLAC